jgi:hypothetical protein
MTQVSYENLIEGKEYIIYREGHDEFNVFWKGTFRGEYERYFDNGPNLVFDHCVQKNNSGLSIGYLMNIDNWKNRADFHKTDIFHDIEKVKENRKKAIENMEKRALNIVLKRLVNETFEW